MYKSLQIKAPRTRNAKKPRGLVIGNCRQIWNKTEQKLYSKTQIFAFAKEQEPIKFDRLLEGAITCAKWLQ